MVIAAISSVNVNYNNYTAAKQKRPITVPIESKAPEAAASSFASKSYFLGGNAISFKGQQCSTSNFKLKHIDEVPCCCCGDTMIRKSELNKHSMRLNGPQGDELVKVINEEERYMRSAERTTAYIIADAVKGTDKDFAGGIETVKDTLPERITKYCKSILGQIYVASVEETGSYDTPVGKFVQSTVKKLEQNQNFDRIAFTEKLAKFKGELSKESYARLEDTAMNLPEDFEAIYKIFDKYQRQPGKMAHRLFSTAMTTAEHVQPASLGGPNNTANYLAECAGCNNPRGNMSYSEWLKVHPEFPRKVQDHIEHVEERIVNGELPGYDGYPSDIEKTLTKESEGVMRLVVLSTDKLKELREAKRAGKEVNIHEETLALIEERKKAEEQAT